MSRPSFWSNRPVVGRTRSLGFKLQFCAFLRSLRPSPLRGEPFVFVHGRLPLPISLRGRRFIRKRTCSRCRCHVTPEAEQSRAEERTTVTSDDATCGVRVRVRPRDIFQTQQDGRTSALVGKRSSMIPEGQPKQKQLPSPPSIFMTAEFSGFSSTREALNQALARSVAPIQLITLSLSASSLSGSLCCGC